MSARRGGESTEICRTTVTTGAPSPFDFAGTAYSNGWAVLEPNEWDRGRVILRRTERLGQGRIVQLNIRGIGSAGARRVSATVIHEGELRAEEKVAIRRLIRRMFRLDEDLRPFHDLCRKAGRHWEPVSQGLGRLLRSPTVFEDAVKTICTTNVQWGGTKAMVRALVRQLGEPGPLGALESGRGGEGPPRSFPTPRAIAAADDSTLEAARLGYRAPFVRELARRVMRGSLDLEALRDPARSTDEVRHLLLEIKGIGPYAAATMLMLLGRYDRLAIDSVYRTFVSERYFDGGRPSDREAAEVYAKWGRWKYLAYWFDLWQGSQEEV